MRKKIVAGNWKMYKTIDEGIALVKEIATQLAQNPDLSADNIKLVIICPPFPLITAIRGEIHHQKLIKVGAQNCHWENEGAFTGEVSASMLRSAGAEYVLIGHSERRQYFPETNEVLAKKINTALRHHLVPVYCCGETLEERKNGKQFEVVGEQLKKAIFLLPGTDMQRAIIAYEPVWAIGTGLTATPQQAQDMHAFIRQLIAQQYGSSLAETISILYGGSCKPSNARELFAQPDIDGGLIGGASLQAADFIKIINSF